MTGDLVEQMLEPPRARATDPETAKSAARAIESKVNKLQAIVLEHLKAHPGGATTREIAEAAGIEWTSISPRMRPLADRGLVIDSGEIRRSPGHREQIVWRLAPPGT